eukprot:481616-Amphidinium_carterae.1
MAIQHTTRDGTLEAYEELRFPDATRLGQGQWQVFSRHDLSWSDPRTVVRDLEDKHDRLLKSAMKMTEACYQRGTSDDKGPSPSPFRLFVYHATKPTVWAFFRVIITNDPNSTLSDIVDMFRRAKLAWM